MNRMIVNLSTRAALALLVAGGALTATPAYAQRAALTRDVDNGALQPFRALISANLNAAETSKFVDGPVVPAGKRLVVENASVWISTNAGADIATGVWLTVPGSNPATFALLDPTATERKLLNGGSSITAYNRLLKLYYNPGETVQLVVFFDGTSAAKIANVYLNGYFVNVP